MKNYCIVTFYSTHLALKFERILKKASIDVKIIPVPRQISSSCGLSGRILKKDLDNTLEICIEENLDFDDVYLHENKIYKKICSK